MRTEHDNRALFEGHRKEIEQLAEWFSTRYFVSGYENADIKQELCLRAFEQIFRWDEGRGPLMYFLGTVMERQAVTLLKASQRQKRKALNESASLSDLLNNETVREESIGQECPRLRRAEQQFIIADQLALLRTQLSPLEFQALYLRANDLSYPEIIARTGQKEKAIDNALTRARRKIHAIQLEQQSSFL